MFQNQLEQVLNNTPDVEARAARILEARRKAWSPTHMAADTLESAASAGVDTGSELVPEMLGAHGVAEAIVLAALRPAFFVTELAIELSNAVECDETLLAEIDANRNELHRLSKGVGRVNLINHLTLPYAGTGFLIDENLVVTNRHVALFFAERLRSGYGPRKGRFGADVEAQVDYHRYLGASSRLTADVTEVLYIATDAEPDFALLRVSAQPDRPILGLLGGVRRPMTGKTAVAAVGYPAEDGDRNDRALMDEVFKGQYQVKRFAPGFLTEGGDDIVLTADYSSLGGNSGSPMMRLSDGKVIGLHFSGRFMENNYAVAADVIEAARKQVLRSISVAALPLETPVSAVAGFAGRNGYAADFLGQGELSVPLPRPGRWKDDLAPVSDATDQVLRYRNFSTVQSVSRRLPLLTAVNIDGEQAVLLKREGDWQLDGRLEAEHQIGNALYTGNALDRGHMVRRRDPGWGKHAAEGEADTFHYTNSAPQHEDLNQKDWVGLEDYVLEAAETRGFKVSVFTGPVFRDSDRALARQPGAEGIRIPEEFWKVAVMINATTGKLTATGYVLSHGPMIRKLLESPFVYGSYKTYQVRIAFIAAETGLDFGDLPNADPLGAALPHEARFGEAARVVDGAASLVLTAP